MNTQILDANTDMTARILLHSIDFPNTIVVWCYVQCHTRHNMFTSVINMGACATLL